ncbi:hypothetical protein MLD38_017966 [Melastoma candidum]|uniref:Uncharacterized protein n=1 Tax=Melastoma candidum TaxID=119954 RepID=A0ACB9QSA3_9MYRT|nr:hypothetical protein MLD38_017966 [Melastoma candidum]
MEAVGGEKESMPSSMKHLSRKKRSIEFCITIPTYDIHTSCNHRHAKSQDSNISWPSCSSFGSDFSNECFTTNVVPFKFNKGIQGFDEERYDNKAKQPDFRYPSPRKPHLLEAEVDLSDSASSLSTRGAIARRHCGLTDNEDASRESNWEINYVKEILRNIELMFKDFTLGRANEIISPHLFDSWKAERILGQRFVMVRRKEWLSEDIYKEIVDWRRLGDSMVDDLVDKE